MSDQQDEFIDLLRERNRLDREQLENDRLLVEENRQRKRIERIRAKNAKAAYRAEQARYRLLESAFPDYIKLSEQLGGILPLIRLHLEQLPALSEFHEAQEEIHQEIEMIRWLLDKLFDLVNLAMAGNGKKRQAETIMAQVHAEQDRFSIQQQLIQLRRNLRILEERRASYGLDIPVKIINEIEQIEEEINRLERLLKNDDFSD